MSRLDKIRELMDNEAFVEKLSEVSTVEEMQSIFADNGVEMTLDEINEMCMASVQMTDSDELSDTDLDNVSGGAVSIKKAVKAIIGGFKFGWKAGKKFSDWMYEKFGVN